jgi:hypothetical protein
VSFFASRKTACEKVRQRYQKDAIYYRIHAMHHSASLGERRVRVRVHARLCALCGRGEQLGGHEYLRRVILKVRVVLKVRRVARVGEREPRKALHARVLSTVNGLQCDLGKPRTRGTPMPLREINTWISGGSTSLAAEKP